MSKATMLQIFNMTADVHAETGFLVILQPSRKNRRTNVILSFCHPSIPACRMNTIGDIPKRKARDYMLKFIEDNKINKPRVAIAIPMKKEV